MDAILNDPRRRNLAMLAVAAVVLSALAVLALWQQSARTAPQYSRETFLPELIRRVDDVARIRIVSHKNGLVEVAFRPDRGWVLTSRNDYPASVEQVRKTIVGLVAMQTIEPKTARPDWLRYVDLDDPAKSGGGLAITLFDDKGKEIAAIVTGKTEDIGDPGGAIGLFVRKPGDNQSWLVRSVVQPSGDPGEWVEKDVLGIDRSRIRETDVTPADGPAYVVRREKPSDAEFALLDVPKGREVTYESAPSGIGAAIVGFNFDDVKPDTGFDFSNATRVVTKTFDGLVVTTRIIQLGQDYWAQISAEASPGDPDAEKEARDIDARTHGWAYKLPAYKGQQFMTTRESLLKPAATKDKT